MSFILSMKWSFVAFAVTLALGLISMGLLGGLLYYACYPLLGPFYGNLNHWRGDWVWSATIGAGMLWSVSFLAAGWLNLHLEPYASALLRGIGYVVVLWLGAALIWAYILMASYEAPDKTPFVQQGQAEMIGCDEINPGLVEALIAGVFNPAPKLIDEPRCVISRFRAAAVSMVEIAPDFTPQGTILTPGTEKDTYFLSILTELYPDAFSVQPRIEFESASIFNWDSKIHVHFVRTAGGRQFVAILY